MKIAVLLFGHLRTFEYCAPYLKANLLDRYDCDVFMHTWDELDSHTKSWDNKHDIEGVLTDYHKQLINDFYNPKAIKIEHQEIEQDVVISSLINDKKLSFNGMMFMMHSLAHANLLRKKYEQETNTHYDCIVVTRPDVALYTPLPIERSFTEASVLGYNIENVRFFAGLSNISGANVALMVHRGCDILFFGKSQSIDNFIEANQNIDLNFAKNHFLNTVSIYVANEVKFGNNPQLICFEFGKDWKNIKVIPNQNIFKQKSHLYKFLHFYWLRGKK